MKDEELLQDINARLSKDIEAQKEWNEKDQLTRDVIVARVSCLTVNHIMAMRAIVDIADGRILWPERDNLAMNDILDLLGMPKCEPEAE
jgi:hypothetical protein